MRRADTGSMRIASAHDTEARLDAAIAAMASAAAWTGGGTVTLIRAANGELWVDELVPAFPD